MPVASPALSGSYFVSVGLFANHDSAVRLVGELMRSGFAARQRPFQLRRQRVQQVLVGPFATRDAASEALARLHAAGAYGDAHVVDVTSAASPD
jgi:DedD protein